MKKILEILIMLLVVATVLIEVYSTNDTSLTVLYYVLIICMFFRYRRLIIDKDYYDDTRESRVVTIAKVVCFYVGLGGVFFLWSNWSEYPLYLSIPRMIFWVSVGLFPMIYFKNTWKNN